MILFPRATRFALALGFHISRLRRYVARVGTLEATPAPSLSDLQIHLLLTESFRSDAGACPRDPRNKDLLSGRDGPTLTVL